MATKTQRKIKPSEKALREDLEKRKITLLKKDWSFNWGDGKLNLKKNHGGQEVETGALESVENVFDIAEQFEKYWAETATLKIPQTNANKPEISSAKTKIESPSSVVESEIYAEFVPVDKCVPSPLASQERRRLHYTEESLDSMAESIKKPHGVIEPIIVRGIFAADTSFKNALQLSHYEIVAGERRWRGSVRAAKKTIPARILELTDAEAADIQITENIQREDLSPLDEAFAYADMMDIFGYDVQEIAARVGKDSDYVKKRLRLKSLPETVTKALDDDIIGLRHAEEIAKYSPEQQEEIFAFCFEKKYWASDEKTLRPIAQMRKAIQQDYLKLLKHAPFPTDSEDLHAVSCKKCLVRTGPKQSLFNDDFEVKDACLNPTCWDQKKIAFVNLTREKIAAETLEIPREKAAEHISKVPLLQGGYLKEEEKPSEDLIPTNNFRKLEEKNLCTAAKKGVYFNGDNLGEEQWFCDSPVCPTHGRSFQTEKPKSPEEIKDDESLERRKRKEELFDVRVRSLVRIRVFKHAAEKFDGLKDAETDILRPMVQRWWHLQKQYSSDVAEALAYIVCGYFNLEDAKKQYILSTVSKHIENHIEKLSDENLRRVAFLLLRGTVDKMFFFEERSFVSPSYQSQKQVKELAAEFDINYTLFDAQVRLALAPPKNKDVFRAYLLEVEAGNVGAIIPRIWSVKWKPEDK